MMRVALVAVMLMAGVLVWGCSTSEPGVKNTMGTLTTVLAADPPETALAAHEVLEDLDLLRVTSISTEVDGRAVGYTAKQKKVSVSIHKEGEGLTKVSVRVGTFGDETIGIAVIRRLEEKMGVPGGEEVVVEEAAAEEVEAVEAVVVEEEAGASASEVEVEFEAVGEEALEGK